MNTNGCADYPCSGCDHCQPDRYPWFQVIRDCPVSEAEAIIWAVVTRVQEFALSESDEALVGLCYAAGDLEQTAHNAFDRAKKREAAKARLMPRLGIAESTEGRATDVDDDKGAPFCRCGRVWEGHPEPHALDCEMRGRS